MNSTFRLPPADDGLRTRLGRMTDAELRTRVATLTSAGLTAYGIRARRIAEHLEAAEAALRDRQR